MTRESQENVTNHWAGRGQPQDKKEGRTVRCTHWQNWPKMTNSDLSWCLPPEKKSLYNPLMIWIDLRWQKGTLLWGQTWCDCLDFFSYAGHQQKESFSLLGGVGNRQREGGRKLQSDLSSKRYMRPWAMVLHTLNLDLPWFSCTNAAFKVIVDISNLSVCHLSILFLNAHQFNWSFYPYIQKDWRWSPHHFPLKL